MPIDRRGLATLLNLLEASPDLWTGGSPDTLAALDHAYLNPRPGTRVIGLTGPPGVGKSTLSGRLINHWRRQGLTVGVLCIDPSSKFSGGALLGDRLRMQLTGTDPNIFVRSMATRDRLGGLAPRTLEAVIETVGVGQSETEVSGLADVTAVVIQPGSGDALQFLKAGLMEVFDVLVVNKSDLGPLAEAARRELVSALRVMGRRDASVIMTSALTDAGIDALALSLEDQDNSSEGHIRLATALVERILSEYVAWRGLERVNAEGGVGATRARLSAVPSASPRTLAEALRS
jgi:LAO/AO transport system kinase